MKRAHARDVRHAGRRAGSPGEPRRETFSEQRFHGTYRKALLAVLAGEADVAAIYSSHPEENTVRAYLAEHVGANERELIPFELTGPTPADGLIVTHRMAEEDVAALVSVLTTLAGGGAGLEPLLGLFDSEGFARYLECGVLAHGFARVRCESCKDELLVAFSCKGRD